MQLKTILNHVQKHKSFVYDEARFVQDGDRQQIEVTIRSRKNGQPLCGECRQPGACYGRLEPRRYEFVPLWGIAVFFTYARRRVKCPVCGVKAEWVPWAEGKQTLTKTYQRFWEYRSVGWAEKFFHEWCTRAMRSRLEPMKKVARSLRNHHAEILNRFRANGTILAGIVEGRNNKVKLSTRKSYGVRT